MQHQMPLGGFRPILPRVGQRPHAGHRPSLTGKGSRSSVACEICRKKKVKCDAIRPTCSACLSLALVCVYRTAPAESSMAAIKRKYGELETYVEERKTTQSAMEQLFHAMQTRPEAEAAAIFARIRSAANPETILRQVSTGDLLLQLHVTPETRYRFEFPLRIDMPDALRSPANPYLQSRMYEAAFSPLGRKQPSPAFLAGNPPPSQYVKPYFTATIVDPRLDAVKPSQWSEVSKDDHLMRQLLRSYFSHEHQLMGCLHKDDFLDDMMSGSTQYCTPLLVNAVLALACHSYRQLPDRMHYWDPNTLGYKFFAEAKRLWELESNIDKSLTTIQTALIFNNLCNVNCVDKIGIAYKNQAIAIAHELGLFDPLLDTEGKRVRDSRTFTAWGGFFWISMQDFHFRLASPNLVPPSTPLPDPDEKPDWYGEFYIRYPMDSKPLSVNFEHLFKAKCDLALLMNAVSNNLFTPQGEHMRRSKHRPGELAKGFIQNLQAWYDALPVSLLPKNVVFPAQFQLHVLYHDIMSVLCETVLNDTTASIFGSPRAGTQLLLAYSKMAFETLMRLYYLRHGFEGCDCYLIQDLQVLAYLAQNQLKGVTDGTVDGRVKVEEARSTLFLAAKGLHIQGQNYYLALQLSHILQTDMRSEEASMLYKFTDVKRESSGIVRPRADHIQAQYPVSIVATKDRAEKSPGLGEVLLSLGALSIQTGSDNEMGTREPSRASSSTQIPDLDDYR
ncbi:nitrate assimilation regulatory protein nirA [Massarina eburnea CBS 473.64]|uniref:Nitrate assimilation regulatory protein nirA n=1 Tax=Massarina eburnea CBS 473.64 TaxID=1395130 RepID=A0A6A6RJX9_9PLEO|nr:nitrate assimilation regulatory protein nirA [Massarina eburnea CBS 473.64]